MFAGDAAHKMRPVALGVVRQANDSAGPSHRALGERGAGEDGRGPVGSVRPPVEPAIVLLGHYPRTPSRAVKWNSIGGGV